MPNEMDVTLGGQYRLSHCLGSGGMGTVWEARDCRLNRQVAIKFLDTQHIDAAAAAQRFQREAVLAAKLQSPHVVQIFAQGATPEGRPYIVMELLKGEDLRTRIAREGPLDPPLALAILDQVKQALTHAHHQGLVHRDIKPPNIFLLPDRSGKLFVKLLDFGVAKDIHTPITKLTFTGAFIGTLYYISPEQLTDPQRVGPSADIWASAVTAYEMLTGTVPFGAGAAVPELLFKISRGAYVPPTTANPHLPRAVDMVFAKAFRSDPEERFRTIEELYDELSHVLFRDRDLSPTLSASEAPSYVERVQLEAAIGRRPARRRAVCAGLGLLGLGLGAGAWWLSHKPDHPATAMASGAVKLTPPTQEPPALSLAQEVSVIEHGIAPPEAAASGEPRSASKPKPTANRDRSAGSKTAPASPKPRVVNYGF